MSPQQRDKLFESVDAIDAVWTLDSRHKCNEREVDISHKRTASFVTMVDDVSPSITDGTDSAVYELPNFIDSAGKVSSIPTFVFAKGFYPLSEAVAIGDHPSIKPIGAEALPRRKNGKEVVVTCGGSPISAPDFGGACGVDHRHDR